MLIVLDNVLDNDHRNAVVNFFSKGEEERKSKWQDGSLDTLKDDQSPMALLLAKAGNYFDLSSMVGSEYWSHYGTKPDWHIDKDEVKAAKNGDIVCPICSIVYYGVIDNLTGGRFMTETEIVIPKTNRMIIFSAGILHTVEEYSGVRLSVAVNPWSYKPMGY